MTYFRNWKAAQHGRHKAGAPREEWEPMFLSKETFKKMLRAICGWFHFSNYLLGYLPEKIPDWSWTPMQGNNQTPIEGKIGALRVSQLGYPNMGKHNSLDCSSRVSTCRMIALI